MSEFLVITGLSGAGRTTAASALEDRGWFIIDNLPPALISKVAELVGDPGSSTQKVALVVGRGGDDAGEVAAALGGLRAMGARVRVMFLEASDEVLVRRFENTRRRHPLAGEHVVGAAIAHERAILEPLKDQADVVVDTGDLNVHQLRERVVELIEGEDSDADGSMQTTVVSFGYKHGIPLDADLVLDCRFVPNPHWIEELRDQTGLDEGVRRFVLSQPEAVSFLDRLDELFALLLPAYVKEGKSYLSIAVGCTGGRHRSVVLAEEIARRISARGLHPVVRHRDVAR